MPIAPELRERLPLVSQFGPDDLFPEPSAEILGALAAFAAPVGDYRRPEVVVRADTVPGPHGEVGLRIYEPRSTTASGDGLVWMHGGAFVGGDLDMPEADGVARDLSERYGAVVVSVDYRLARDGVHFPVSHDDVISAWHWAVKTSAKLGVEPGRLGLGGGSAGANLAAGAALRLRDERSAMPGCLLLAYPAIAQHLHSVDSLPEDIVALPRVLRHSPEDHERILANYLGDTTPSPYAVPALGDPAGLPPTAILTCEYDDLRPSAEAYAGALRRAGVTVAIRCERGALHGHLNIPGLPATEASLRFLGTALVSGVSKAVGV